MRLRVRYFAAARERAGIEAETIELEAGATVGAALDTIGKQRTALRPLFARLRVAVNEEFASVERVLADGDEMALIPPVAGGAEGRGGPAVHVELTDSPLSVDRAIERVGHPGAGAISVFVGVVRDNAGGRRVDRIEYEAYAEMAERQMRAIAEAIVARIEGVRLAVLHRTGSLAVGESSVVIAASAPHRDEAFLACREAIDRLKESVPIWKKEFGEGEPVWVNATHEGG